MTVKMLGAIALTSLAWSLFDLSRKKLGRALDPMHTVIWVTILQTPIMAFMALTETWGPIPSDYWLPALASLLLNLFANLWFVQSVSLAPLSLAIPILSLGPVFSALGAFLLLGELTTPRQAIGIAIIVGATFVLGARGAKKGDPDQDPALVRKGLVLMGLVALLWATAPVLDKMCLRAVPGSQHGFLQCLGIALTLVIWVKSRGRSLALEKAKANAGWLTFAVVVSTTALLAQFWTIQIVPIGIFEALKRSSGLVTALMLGYFVFREPLSIFKSTMVVIMSIGIFILLF